MDNTVVEGAAQAVQQAADSVLTTAKDASDAVVSEVKAAATA